MAKHGRVCLSCLERQHVEDVQEERDFKEKVQEKTRRPLRACSCSQNMSNVGLNMAS